jgi:hypothetical protein
MFTVYQVMKYQGTSPINLLHPVQKNQQQPSVHIPASASGGFDPRLIPDQPPREVVIRIVKEVVHVREDGSVIEHLRNDHKQNNATGHSSLNDLAAEEIEKLLAEDSNGSLLNEVLEEAVGDKLNDSTLTELRDVSTYDMRRHIDDDEDEYSNDHDSLTQKIFNKLLYRCVV